MTFTTFEIATILAGALLGGFVSGLTGFGLALAAVPIWLQALAPPLAAALATASSVFSQAQTFHLVWGKIDWRRVAPFVAAGLAGVPIGTVCLPLIDVALFKLGVGVVLIVYCGFQLGAQRLAALGFTADKGPLADALIGFGGGIMGGIAGLSGPLPIMWATFKPWSRDEKRAMFQVFNTAILLASFCSIAWSGLLPAGFWLALAIGIPATVAGAWLGAAVYQRLDDRRFDRVVLSMLLTMGIVLIVTSL